MMAGIDAASDLTVGTTSAATVYSYSHRNTLTGASSPSFSVSYTSGGDGLRQTRTTSAVTDQFLWDTIADWWERSLI